MSDEQDEQDDRPEREKARAETRARGDRSAKLARQLMEMNEAFVKRLELDEDLKDKIVQARRITAHVARRRAERTLAGDLRGHDLIAIGKQIDDVTNNRQDVAAMHLAEHWRARLIEEGAAAIAEFPNADDELPRLVDAARREKDTGKPPGAARALFRHVAKLL